MGLLLWSNEVASILWALISSEAKQRHQYRAAEKIGDNAGEVVAQCLISRQTCNEELIYYDKFEQALHCLKDGAGGLCVIHSFSEWHHLTSS